MRTIEIDNQDLKYLFGQRLELQKTVNEKVGQIEALQEDLNKLGMDSQKIKDKMKIILDDAKLDLAKYEYVNKVDVEGEIVRIIILDQVEEYTKALDEKLEKEKVIKDLTDNTTGGKETSAE